MFRILSSNFVIIITSLFIILLQSSTFADLSIIIRLTKKCTVNSC